MHVQSQFVAVIVVVVIIAVIVAVFIVVVIVVVVAMVVVVLLLFFCNTYCKWKGCTRLRRQYTETVQHKKTVQPRNNIAIYKPN